MRRIFPGFVVATLLTLPAGAAEVSDEASASLISLNSAFIAAHMAANEADLAAGGPIILLRDGELILVRNGTEVAAPLIPSEYEVFKSFAHLPVAIYLMLGPHGTGKLDAERLKQLNSYRGKIDRVEDVVDRIGLTGDDLERQKRILTASKMFLANVAQRQQVSSEDLHAFTRKMMPMIKANLNGAAKSQLDAMHRQVMAWKAELTAEEWKKLRVALKGAVLARDDNLAKQYFERLLHIEGEGLRLAYMERYDGSMPMQALLATRSVDRGIGIAIFDDPDRMFRDVLADAAKAHIDTMDFNQ